MSRGIRSRLGLEMLEQRAMLAGDVQASVVLGNLKLQGDAQANEIAVTDLGGGQIEVTGQVGTTINGQPGHLNFSGINLGLKVDLKGGNDKVALTGNAGHVLPRVAIETGAGDDTISIDKVFAGLAKIETGVGDDTVNVMDVTAVLVEIETGAGDDLVNLGNSTIRPDATVKAVALAIETGEGNDRIQIQDAIIQAIVAEIDTGAGDDLIDVRDLQAQGRFKMETLVGKDAVTIADSTFNSLVVELGGGDNDSLVISNTQATKAKLGGGLGTGDSLSIVGSNLGALKTEGFETIA